MSNCLESTVEHDNTKPLDTASHSSGSTTADPPPNTSLAFESAIYRALAGPDAPVDEKVRAGYKLIDGQRRDLSRLLKKKVELDKALEQKHTAIDQLYSMLEPMQPLLAQLDENQKTLSNEEASLMQQITQLQKALDLPVEDFSALLSKNSDPPSA